MINRCTPLVLAAKPLLLYSVCYRAFIIIKMSKIFFGKLKSFNEVLKSDGWNEFVFLDYDDKHDLVKQLKDKIDFLCENENHWIEIELCSNGYNYWKNSEKKTIIIHEDWLSERRD